MWSSVARENSFDELVVELRYFIFFVCGLCLDTREQWRLKNILHNTPSVCLYGRTNVDQGVIFPNDLQGSEGPLNDGGA
jgi:hypothetical protein